MRSSIVTAERSCSPACVRSGQVESGVWAEAEPDALAVPSPKPHRHATQKGYPGLPGRGYPVYPESHRGYPEGYPVYPEIERPLDSTDAGDSGRPHPLDELLFRAALEQCVSHMVDALRAA